MNRRVITIALFWLVCGALSVAQFGVVHAQPELQDKYTPEEWKRGTKLFKQGLRLFRAGKYAKACARLEKSYRVVAGIGVRGKIGECYEKLEKYAQAWLAYRDVVEMAVKSADLKRVKVARKRVAELEKLITLVTVESAATPIKDLIITVDGEPVQLMERTFPLDPGTRAIAVKDGAKTEATDAVFEKTIKARAGRRDTLEVPDLAFINAAQDDPKARGGSTTLVVLGIVGVTAGLGAMGAGGYFGYQAREKWEEAADPNGTCERETGICTDANDRNLALKANDHALRANILVGSGLLLGTVGTIMWLSGRADKPRKSREKNTRRARNKDLEVGWRVAPGDGMSVVVSGRF